MIDAIQKNPFVAAVSVIVALVALAGGAATAWYTVTSLNDLVHNNGESLSDIRGEQEEIRRELTEQSQMLAGIANEQKSFDNLHEEHRWMVQMFQGRGCNQGPLPNATIR